MAGRTRGQTACSLRAQLNHFSWTWPGSVGLRDGEGVGEGALPVKVLMDLTKG